MFPKVPVYVFFLVSYLLNHHEPLTSHIFHHQKEAKVLFFKSAEEFHVVRLKGSHLPNLPMAPWVFQDPRIVSSEAPGHVRIPGSTKDVS